MRLTPKMQTALLFCLYLSRAGKASDVTLIREICSQADAAYEILGYLFSEGVVSREMEEHPMQVTYVYTLEGNPTVGDILKAVSPKGLLTPKETASLKLGQHEHRALALLATSLSSALDPFLKRTMPGLNNDLILAELTQLDGAAEIGTGN